MAETGVQNSGLHGTNNKFDAADLLISIIYYEKCRFHCECVDDCGMFSQSEMPLFMIFGGAE